MTEPLPCRRCGKVPIIYVDTCWSLIDECRVIRANSACNCDDGYAMAERIDNGEFPDDFRQRFIEKYNEQQDAGK